MSNPKKKYDREAVRRFLEAGAAQLEREKKDYLTASNDNTIVRTPTIKKRENPHLTNRVSEGARAKARLRAEHPVRAAVSDAVAAAPLAVAAAPFAAAAAPYLAPGSAFWTHPLTQGMAAGTAMAEGVDALTNLTSKVASSIAPKAFTPVNNWSDLVSKSTEELTGWNPDKSMWTAWMPGMTNPGWWMNPAGTMRTIGKVGDTAENVVKNQGFAYVNGDDINWVGKGMGSQIGITETPDGWLAPTSIYSTSSGTGRKLYDAAILEAHRRGLKGVKSGESLISAPKTYSTWEHYPNKQLLELTGHHSNTNMVTNPVYKAFDSEQELIDATKNGIKGFLVNGPVYGLTTPSRGVASVRIPSRPKSPWISRPNLINFSDLPDVLAFKNETKPAFLAADFEKAEGDLLFSNATKLDVDDIRYYINEDLLKQTISKYKPLYESRLGISGNVDDIYLHILDHPEILRPQGGYEDLIGVSLGFEPENAIMYNLENTPGGISLNKLNSYGYEQSVPEIYNFLKDRISNGGYSRRLSTVNGNHVGYFDNIPEGLVNDKPLVAQGIPLVTSVLEPEVALAFINGTKPMYLGERVGGETADNLFKNAKTIDFLDKRFYVNEDALKLVIEKYKPLYESRLGITGSVDDIYQYLLNHPLVFDPRWNGKGAQDILGISLGYEPENAIMYNLEQQPAGISLENLNSFGYELSIPEVYNFLKDRISSNNYSREVSTLNGRHVGYFNDTHPGEVRYFKDSFGNEIAETPYPGTDEELLNQIQELLVLALRQQFSPEKTQQLKQTLGWGDKEISEYQDELLRSLGTLATGEVKGINDGFLDIAQHSGYIRDVNGELVPLHVVTLNRDRIANDNIAKEAILHELGGHAATMSINPEELNAPGWSKRISEQFPRMTELMLKNLELAKSILEPNELGKLYTSAKNTGDIERYLYENDIPRDLWVNYFNNYKRFKYMDTQEKVARGRVGLIWDKYYGNGNATDNIKQLEQFYTPESVRKFKEAVLSTFPWLIGASALYNNNEDNLQ